MSAVSNLSEELESLIERVMGCCLAVHGELGPGLNELAYSRGCSIELQERRVNFEVEKAIAISAADRSIDERQLVLEIKSVGRLRPVYVAQTLSSLRIIGVRAGLLVNFNVPVLKQGIRRVV